jgi:hypothetical protein
MLCVCALGERQSKQRIKIRVASVESAVVDKEPGVSTVVAENIILKYLVLVVTTSCGICDVRVCVWFLCLAPFCRFLFTEYKEQRPSWEDKSFISLRNFSAFYETQSFITCPCPETGQFSSLSHNL